MAFVVVLEPCRQLRQDCFRVRTIVNIHVIPFEGFDECLRHAVRLWAAHRREARYQAEASRKVDRLVSSVAAAIVREPLDWVWQAASAETSLDALEHQIPDHLPADPARAGAPGHNLSVASVQRKSHADHLTVPAGDLKPIRGPA